ncbi:HlyU family transcriptional regulator [Neptunomonas phycophila]|uniref:HlyU family transcriptional regulator n=1 Tax=Neptunomonas phycophila TaxID=1572645 RepID=UPI001BE681EE|nr:HlyU family transcriptional regulator [Neptunomonas phycophila]MBT3145903.1 hypothetical protein [Neptunomonas phycophila]
MSIINILTSFFSTKESREKNYQTEQYKGYVITAQPLSENGQYRINGTVTKDELSHNFIRADQFPSEALCQQETFRKAKLLIDQQGDSLFN